MRMLNVENILDQALVFGYRFASYALMNLADDAAILALMFC
jgi:hypothetical protein